MTRLNLPEAIKQMALEIGRTKPTSDFTSIVNRVFDQILLQTPQPESSTEQADKQCFTTLVFAILQAAKLNLSPEEFKTEMSQFNWSSELLDLIVERFKKDLISIRDMLSRIGWHPAEILDVDWRLEHIIKSSGCDSVGLPRFTVSIPMEELNSTSPSIFKFQCSTDQLQDLVWKLREANQCVTKASNSL